MKSVFYYIFFNVLLYNVLEVVSENFTFTYDMALRCKKHVCQQGYNYHMFYSLDDKDLKHMTKTSNLALEMHIAVQAGSNGHILLSPVLQPTATDPVYEIVVGGGGNKFTELRRNLRRNARSSVKTPGILSTIDLRAFYIRISEDGLIEFGKEGEALPLISYLDIDPLEIRYFSFAAWNGVEAVFLYDCPAPGDTSGYAPDSQEIVPKLSNSDELKRTLLMARLPSVPPASTVAVQLGVRIIQIMYDAFEAKLTTRVAVVMSWTDDSMAWNPSKFNGTTKLKFRQGQIWRPKFFVLNSDSHTAFDTKNADLITMVYSGEATFHFQSVVSTWCFVKGGERWPRDRYNCAIIIQPWEAYEKISLQVLSQNDTKMKVFADIDTIVENEWDGDIAFTLIKSKDWIGFNDTNHSDRIAVRILMERQGNAYTLGFYTPLIVLLTFVLMSFWNEPLTMSRVWFYAGSAVFISMGLCYIDYLIPCHTVPSILILYITVLGGVLLALLIQVILMTNLMDQVTRRPRVQAVLTAAVFRSIFCLPPIKTCNTYESINEAYATQEDDDSGVIVAPRNGNVEEMESDGNTTYGDKAELAVVVDKAMFVIYSVVFAAMLAAHY